MKASAQWCVPLKGVVIVANLTGLRTRLFLYGLSGCGFCRYRCSQLLVTRTRRAIYAVSRNQMGISFKTWRFAGAPRKRRAALGQDVLDQSALADFAYPGPWPMKCTSCDTFLSEEASCTPLTQAVFSHGICKHLLQIIRRFLLPADLPLARLAFLIAPGLSQCDLLGRLSALRPCQSAGAALYGLSTSTLCSITCTGGWPPFADYVPPAIFRKKPCKSKLRL